MVSSIIRGLTRAASSLHVEPVVGSFRKYFVPGLPGFLDGFEVSFRACLDRFRFSVPSFLEDVQISPPGPSCSESCAELQQRNRHVEKGSRQVFSANAQQSGLPVDRSICGVAYVDVQWGFPFLEVRNCDVVPRDCGLRACLSSSAAPFSVRYGRPCVPASQYDAGTGGGSRDGGGARQSGVMLRSRGYAAKTKKAKSRTEDMSDVLEDVGVTSKQNAVKMMETALDVLSREHSKMRTGRASSGMLDHLTVDAHGVRTPLSHIAAVTVSGLQTLNVLPYDASMVKEVEKSILNSPLGLNPQVDGSSLTVPLPRLTKEHCETMSKLAGKAGESAKLTIRRARKEALDSAKKSGSFSKDEINRFEKEVDDLTKKYTKAIDETCKRKEKEIMS